MPRGLEIYSTSRYLNRHRQKSSDSSQYDEYIAQSIATVLRPKLKPLTVLPSSNPSSPTSAPNQRQAQRSKAHDTYLEF